MMEYRALGKTGEKLSVIGFGGIIVMNETPEQAQAQVDRAVESGVTYFDVAPSYGNAEERLGPALEPYREDCFLACKTGQWKKAAAWEELKRSLDLLKTDHFDLYQHHGVSSRADVETILGPGGALECFLEAREQGLVKHLGFSAHSEEAALALLEGYPYDSVLFPVNWVIWHHGHFGHQVVAKTEELGIGLLAIKTLGKRRWAEGEEHSWPKCWYKPLDTLEEAVTGVRFTLSKPVTAAVSPSHAELLWLMLDAWERFTPMSEEEANALAPQAEELEPFFVAP